jgi:hypothetical protein
MFVETKIIGKKVRPLDGWSVPSPPPEDGGGGSEVTLRQLIARVVRGEVEAFEQRQRANRLLRVLSEREIAAGATTGKIDSGGRPPSEPVDEDAAVGIALQGFEDGLYLVILDGVEQKTLDQRVYVRPDSRLVFLRLSFLAGA